MIRWLSSATITEKYGLENSTVRQHIRRYPEWEEKGRVYHPSDRVYLLDEQLVLSIWGNEFESGAAKRYLAACDEVAQFMETNPQLADEWAMASNLDPIINEIAEGAGIDGSGWTAREIVGMIERALFVP